MRTFTHFYENLKTLWNKYFPKSPIVFTFLQYISVKNTVGKGKIACNEQFTCNEQCLLFPTMFSTLLDNFLYFH